MFQIYPPKKNMDVPRKACHIIPYAPSGIFNPQENLQLTTLFAQFFLGETKHPSLAGAQHPTNCSFACHLVEKTANKLLICSSLYKHQLVRFNMFFCFERISGKKTNSHADSLELAGFFSKHLSAPWRGKLGN